MLIETSKSIPALPNVYCGVAYTLNIGPSELYAKVGEVDMEHNVKTSLHIHR